MTTEELLDNVKKRMSDAIVPEEGLQAILDLGRKLDEANAELNVLKEEKAATNLQITELDMKAKTAELELQKVVEERRDKEWIAGELGKFVCDIANGIYEGKEIAAARRVYDLNGGSITKKRLNAYNYDTHDEAWSAFVTWAMTEDKSGRTIDFDLYHEWLFMPVRKQS